MGVPHVRYRYAGPDGREHEGEARLPSALPVEPGQPISVQVHPQDPGRSVIPPRAWSAPVVTASSRSSCPSWGSRSGRPRGAEAEAGVTRLVPRPGPL